MSIQTLWISNYAGCFRSEVSRTCRAWDAIGKRRHVAADCGHYPVRIRYSLSCFCGFHWWLISRVFDLLKQELCCVDCKSERY